MNGPLQIITATVGSEVDGKRILAALDAAGYVCMPIEPTEIMIKDGWASANEENAANTYRDMVRSELRRQAQAIMSLTKGPLDVVSEPDRPARETDAENCKADAARFAVEIFCAFKRDDPGAWIEGDLDSPNADSLVNDKIAIDGKFNFEAIATNLIDRMRKLGWIAE